MSEHDKKVTALIEYGGGIAGGVAGAVIGFLAGGPIGAAIGGAIGPALQTAASEVAARELSRREAMRVGATMSYTMDFIRERLARGDRPREDRFFVADETKRSPAEEIFEGALLKIKSEHEERKARFYGQLLTNVSFDPGCSAAEANYLLHLMDRLTFLQLSLISFFSAADRFPKLPAEDYEGKSIDTELLNVLAATFDLFQMSILKLWKRGDDSAAVVFDPIELVPAHMVLSPTGKRLFDLTGLSAISDSDELQKLEHLFSTVTDDGEIALGQAAALRNK
jgi:hypothetical protein